MVFFLGFVVSETCKYACYSVSGCVLISWCRPHVFVGLFSHKDIGFIYKTNSLNKN